MVRFFVFVFCAETNTTFEKVTDWLAHVPKEVLAHNLGINFSDFANLHQKDPYIIQATAQPGNLTSEEVTYPDGTIPNPFVYKLSQQPVEEKKVRSTEPCGISALTFVALSRVDG